MSYRHLQISIFHHYYRGGKTVNYRDQNSLDRFKTIGMIAMKYPLYIIIYHIPSGKLTVGP